MTCCQSVKSFTTRAVTDLYFLNPTGSGFVEVNPARAEPDLLVCRCRPEIRSLVYQRLSQSFIWLATIYGHSQTINTVMHFLVVSSWTSHCNQRSSNDQSSLITNQRVLVSFVQLLCQLQLSRLQTTNSETVVWLLSASCHKATAALCTGLDA